MGKQLNLLKDLQGEDLKEADKTCRRTAVKNYKGR